MLASIALSTYLSLFLSFYLSLFLSLYVNSILSYSWSQHFREVLQLLQEVRFALCFLKDSTDAVPATLYNTYSLAGDQGYLGVTLLACLRQYQLYISRLRFAQNGRKKRDAKKLTIVTMDEIPPMLLDALVIVPLHPLHHLTPTPTTSTTSHHM